MPKTAQSAAKIARERTDVGAFSAFGLQHRMIGVGGVNKLQPADFDRAGDQFHVFTVASQIIGTLTFDLDGRKARWNLLDHSGEGGQERPDRVSRLSSIAARDDASLSVVGIPFCAPAHSESIE